MNIPLLKRARRLAAGGDDAAAKAAYLDILHGDPTDCAALNELASLALASGHVSAAGSAYRQAVRCHPKDLTARIGLANLLYEQGDLAVARQHFDTALSIAPGLPQAHQGLARILTELGEAAERHWRIGFMEHAVCAPRYRGAGTGVPLLLLVSARGGNIATGSWIDDRLFAVTAIYADFYDLATPLPAHALVVNAIGDADLCAPALAGAEQMLSRSAAPVINPPDRIRATGRENIAKRLAAIPGVITPVTTTWPRSEVLSADFLRFPVLLRSPGFHTGQYFVLVDTADRLAEAVVSLPGERLLAIEYLDARGADGLARKYRIMFIDGVAYPLHLAVSADWKVHYFTSEMAANPAFRAEERHFLDAMEAVLGARAVAALANIQAALGLDYAGIDFGLAPDGSLLLFEANATMVINPPEADEIWDYRRRPIAAALDAAKRMLSRRLAR